MSRTESIYGIHACRQVIERTPDAILEAWVQAGKLSGPLAELMQQLQRQGLPVQRVPLSTLAKISNDGVHQGVVLRCRPLSVVTDLDTLLESVDQPFLLVLDGVQDPHNLGACLRSAAAAGVQAVIVPKDRATGLTPVVRKVAAGAAEIVPLLQVTNLARSLDQLKQAGVWLVGCAGDAETSLYDLDLNRPLALVLGAEDQGLRRLTRERCDYLARIPMPGPIESLNVSVTAGIALFEAVRQRSAG